MSEFLKRSVARTATIMAILTLISKLFGFLREIFLARYFGTNYVVDAYVMSLTILSTLFGGIIIAISTSYLPIFSKIAEERGDETGNKFTSHIINLLILITLFIAVIGFVYSEQIVAIFASGFTGKTANLTSYYVKILFSYIIFSAIAAIFEAYLQYKGSFIPQIISGYFVSLCMIVSIIISAYTSYYFLVFGTLLGHAIRCLLIASIAKAKGYRYYAKLEASKSIKRLFSLAIPVFIGSYISYINLFIDKTLASNLIEGSIAALNYAALINNMIISVTVTILSTILYPKLTQANALGQYDRFNRIVSSGFSGILIIGIPCSLGAVLYSNLVIQIVYERGAFDQVATIMTSSAFRFYAMGMVFIAVNEFVTRIYYSMHETKTPMIFGAISVIINIVLNLIFVRYMEHNGLAFATSIAAMCNTVLLIMGCRKKFGYVKFTLSIKIIKISFAAIISVGVSYLLYMLIFNYIYIRLLQLFIIVLVASIIYIVLLILLKIEEVKLIKSIWK